MNALELIEKVRAYDAEIVFEGDRLVLRGRGERLPADLKAALRQHKGELLIALGAPLDVMVADILREVRPYLPKSLQQLPNAKLQVLVNFTLMHALAKAISEFRRDDH